MEQLGNMERKHQKQRFFTRNLKEDMEDGHDQVILRMKIGIHKAK